MQRRVAKAPPEIRARLPRVAEHELRLTDPEKRLREPAAHHRRGELDPVAPELEPAQDRRQVVARGIEAVARRRELVGSADAIEQRRRVDEGHRSVAARAQVEFIVLATLEQRRVEPTRLAQAIPADDDGRSMHQVPEQHRREDIAGVDRRARRVGRRAPPEIGDCPDALHDMLNPGDRVRIVHRAEEALGDERTVGSDCLHVRPDHPDVGARAKDAKLRLELPRHEDIVGVE
jgi:hypothetical protein